MRSVIARTALWLALAAAVASCQSTPHEVGESRVLSGSASSNFAQIRPSNGLGPISPDASLEQAALQQARYMAEAGRMTHSTSFGRSFGTRVRDNGIRGVAAENVAIGGFTIDELFRRWMNSPGHRRNMLDPAFSHYGLAMAIDATTGYHYWALVLGE